MSFLTLVPALAQILTNGLSILGTLDAPNLPAHLTDNPLPHGYPWGQRTVIDTNPYEVPPFTGVIRNYDFVISRGVIAPDGVEREVILINGAFPGPTLEANWGDTFQVKVTNNLTNEGTGIHWHGLLQRETPWFDGIPSVQQCPIAPGKSLTYQFQADVYGTSWYHSHYSAQYAGGLSGPMVIYGPQHVPYDIDLGPVVLSDWFHDEYMDLVRHQMTVGNSPPRSENNLINGKSNYDCLKTNKPCVNHAGLSKFKFTSGKKHRLRLVNTGAEGTQQFRIDGHNLTVIANDFVPVKPYTVPTVTLGAGQRTDIIVEANTLNSSAAYWMRSDLVCAATRGANVTAAVYYEDADTNAAPTTKAANFTEQCKNDDLSLTTPFYPFGATEEPATVRTIEMTLGKNESGFSMWSMDNSSFRANYNHPLLVLANQGNTSYPDSPQWNVYNFGSNSSVRLIIKNNVNFEHPMHIHGHNFFVLAEGTGEWDGKVTNPKNPQRRDTQIVPRMDDKGPGYIVLQYNQDNPGVWPFHCHIAWHVVAGLYLNIIERPEDIMKKRIPEITRQTCRDWAEFTGDNVVDQIDSGL